MALALRDREAATVALKEVWKVVVWASATLTPIERWAIRWVEKWC